tara:strand:- start:6225 stop:7592 length:1368 start_codon:yes stop_codon:yes gene_type:complete
MNQDVPKRKADVRPTKKLFISTLTRDVDIWSAILDLVDNSVDGAKRVAQERGEKNDYSGLFIEIKINEKEFSISDNCGGIGLELAENYAFKFGRPAVAEGVPGSVGYFGVGMKRTLFKIAEEFRVESTTDDSHFVVHVNVDEWQKDEDDWSFDLDDVEQGVPQPENKIGTKVEAIRIKEEIANELALEARVNTFRESLRKVYAQPMSHGLAIKLNGHLVDYLDIDIFESEELKSSKISHHWEVDEQDLSVKIVAGVAERDTKRSGWYLFFNGRMVLGPDRSSVTGWGENGLPHYHQQFDRFRGFVFLECDDAGVLPWNTTKTGVRTDSDIYRKLIQEMNRATRAVVDFLNNLRTEEKNKEDGVDEEMPLHNAVESAEKVSVSRLLDSELSQGVVHEKFKAPPLQKRQKDRPKTRRIVYDVDIDTFEEVYEFSEARSASDLGRITFNYYYEMEVGG